MASRPADAVTACRTASRHAGAPRGAGAARAPGRGTRITGVIDLLSPRELEEMETAAAGGALWPRVVDLFADGVRLRLGWDRGVAEDAIEARLGGAAAARAACGEAARWCAEHGLHLMSFAGSGPGEDPVGETLWFMAVG